MIIKTKVKIDNIAGDNIGNLNLEDHWWEIKPFVYDIEPRKFIDPNNYIRKFHTWEDPNKN